LRKNQQTLRKNQQSVALTGCKLWSGNEDMAVTPFVHAGFLLNRSGATGNTSRGRTLGDKKVDGSQEFPIELDGEKGDNNFDVQDPGQIPGPIDVGEAGMT
jgi:hypothetical protein